MTAKGTGEGQWTMPSSQHVLWDEWRVNLLKDGGRRVMYGGNAYEDDVEPAPDTDAPEVRGEPNQVAV